MLGGFHGLRPGIAGKGMGKHKMELVHLTDVFWVLVFFTKKFTQCVLISLDSLLPP